MKAVPLEPLDRSVFVELVRHALAEDLGKGDVTTAATVEPDQRAQAIILVKSRCVLAGLDVAFEAIRQLDPNIEIQAFRRDSDVCEPGTMVAEFHGRANALVSAERTALNFLQRLSGIATLTRKFVDAAAGRIVVLDTRKTAPLLRALEKYAVRAGGGTNHRFGLDDGILIKDNHVRLAGGVANAVAKMRRANRGMSIEVEAQSLEQVEEALRAGAEIILLDNLTHDEIAVAVARSRGRAKTEISGGVTLERMPALAATGADYVSIGALTHSAPAADLSLEIEPVG